MNKLNSIQSIQRLIAKKQKRLGYVRTPYVREILISDIADLRRIETELKTDIDTLIKYGEDQVEGMKRLECALRIHGLSDDEITFYLMAEMREIKTLLIYAQKLGEYKTPQRFLTEKTQPNAQIQ